MAVDDIYENKRKYEAFIKNLEDFAKTSSRRKYHCKNPENLEYFRKMHQSFEMRDLSYIRRIRAFGNLKIIVFSTEKNLKDLTRDDINSIMGFMHTVMKSPASKADFIKDIKRTWRLLFPELDEKGREDETVIPYAVRHLNGNIDRSKQAKNWDLLSKEEFERLVKYFNDNPVIQAFLILASDALARPQELLWRTIKDIEVREDSVIVHITDHGKEGIRQTWSYKALPYVMKFLEVHPEKNNQKAYFFLNSKGTRLTPLMVNKHIKKALKDLGIKKRFTAYKLNHQGITDQFANPTLIKKKRGWSDLRQLQRYEHSTVEDAMKLEKDLRNDLDEVVVCGGCKKENRKSDSVCVRCNRRLDGNLNEEHQKAAEYLSKFMEVPDVQKMFRSWVREMVKEEIK